ncbi:DnaD domain protein [Paenibacillus xanthanilyticus]|uniref:DnaD domain protein n=1 Tax=Paenibacillus xanthanilyticus TaxID=1783531 RepID=A0ABV8KCA0_9BACL
MSNEMWKAYARGMASAMNGGSLVVPAGLLRAYHGIGLSDTEFLLLLQLMSFRQLEGIDFPTPEQLADRLGVTPKTAHQMLSRLMKEGFLSIDEHFDQQTGVQSECYNWDGWVIRSAEWLSDGTRETMQASRAERAPEMKATDLFSVFEQEFGRPLSPMECETISIWIDQDRYSDELIRFALKEAVFAGKVHLRYIDRILFEWGRNRVTNAEEARAYTQKFRGPR